MTVLSSKRGAAPQGQLLALPDLELPDSLPLMADEGQALTIPVSAQNRDLRVEIPAAWDGYDQDYAPGLEVRFDFHWRALGSGDFQRVASSPDLPMPQDPTLLFPYTGSSIPERYLRTPGIFETRYSVVIVQNGNPVESPTLQVNLDKTAPNNGNPGLQVELDTPTALIDQAYLDSHGGQVPGTIDTWSDIRLEDVVELFLEPTRGLIADPLSRVVIDAGLKALPRIPFSLAGDVIRRKGNGPRQLYYRLIDRAGNTGQISAELSVQVNLPGAIRLPAPEVPGAEDGLIDLGDVRRGVWVVIGGIPEALPGDILRASWSGRPLPDFPVANPAQWPARIPVDWNTLAMDGFAGPVPVPVAYHLVRGGLVLPSPALPLLVDLSVAGPDPVGPDPINNGLERAVVKGQTGDDQLGEEDVGLPVQVEVRLYADPQADEVLELVWGDRPDVVATYTVQAGDVEGQIVSFTPVDYSVVERQGDGLVAVFYHTFNGVNRQRARDTEVRVATQPLKGFEQVSFPDATLFGWINCEAQPWNGVRVQIPGDAQRLEEGDAVELIWQLFEEPFGEGLALSEKVYFPPRTLTVEEAAQGVIVTMDRFDALVLPVKDSSKTRGEGAAQVEYRVTKLNGQTGITTVKNLNISLVRAGEAICDGR